MIAGKTGLKKPNWIYERIWDRATDIKNECNFKILVGPSPCQAATGRRQDESPGGEARAQVAGSRAQTRPALLIAAPHANK